MADLSTGQKQYLAELTRCQDHIQQQSETIEALAQKIYQSLRVDGVLHVFGTGHSHMLAEELFHRAGGLIPVNAILEEYLMPHMGPRHVGPLERMSGIAEVIFKVYDLRKDEVLILVSNSGINAVTVELAELAKNNGIYTVGITSVTHAKAVPGRAKKKLFEIVDCVLDTGTPVGDACVDIATSDVRVGPLSSLISTLIGELVIVRVAELFAENGEKPPVYQSANTPGGDERNKTLEKHYLPRVRRLR
jgi:uncharacterized phosphosugar-binding protein